jgi:hypothetical protein
MKAKPTYAELRDALAHAVGMLELVTDVFPLTEEGFNEHFFAVKFVLDGAQRPTSVGSLPSLAELRQQHHLPAVLLGLGRDLAEIAALSGTSIQVIESLQSSPAFEALVAFYRNGGTYKPYREHPASTSMSRSAASTSGRRAERPGGRGESETL